MTQRSPATDPGLQTTNHRAAASANCLLLLVRSDQTSGTNDQYEGGCFSPSDPRCPSEFPCGFTHVRCSYLSRCSRSSRYRRTPRTASAWLHACKHQQRARPERRVRKHTGSTGERLEVLGVTWRLFVTSFHLHKYKVWSGDDDVMWQQQRRRIHFTRAFVYFPCDTFGPLPLFPTQRCVVSRQRHRTKRKP